MKIAAQKVFLTKSWIFKFQRCVQTMQRKMRTYADSQLGEKILIPFSVNFLSLFHVLSGYLYNTSVGYDHRVFHCKSICNERSNEILWLVSNQMLYVRFAITQKCTCKSLNCFYSRGPSHYIHFETDFSTFERTAQNSSRHFLWANHCKTYSISKVNLYILN